MKQPITLMEACRSMETLAGKTDRQSLIARLILKDPIISVAVLPGLITTETATPLKLLDYGRALAPKSAYLRRHLVKAHISCGYFDKAQYLERISRERRHTEYPEYDYLRAHNRCDPIRLIAGCERLFMETGDKSLLKEAASEAASNLGWRRAWGYYFRLVLIDHRSYLTHLANLLKLLDEENAQEEFIAFGRVAEKLEPTKPLAVYSRAKRAIWARDYNAAISVLSSSGIISRPNKSNSIFYNCLATCYEKKGEYKKAAQAYAKQNTGMMDSRFTVSAYVNHLEKNKAIHCSELPVDRNTNYLIHAGFPRSGTTLLENAINCHEQIETLEESGALIGTFGPSYTASATQGATEAALRHRNLYYRAIDRRRRTNAAIVIDKTPIISGDIKYLEKLFPLKRYVFSLRHPYDVILSNFKQRYRPNGAMAAFNKMQTACDFYNYVMSSWFEVFPNKTDRVCYVYYDELVTDFEPTVRRVIDFLGLDWDDSVLHFAEHSKKRAVRTPSYANVRKGLSLGVQSSYQNYLFLFDGYCRSKLDPWVEFFGYTVEEP